MARLAERQWYAQPGFEDWRRMQILEFIDKGTLRFLDCYANGTIDRRITSSIQWAWDVRRGQLVLVDPPDEDWLKLKGGDDGETRKAERRKGRKGAGTSKRRGR